MKIVDNPINLAFIESEIPTEKTLEPRDYFKNFKAQISEAKQDEINKKLKEVESLIKKADSIGQENLVNQMKMIWRACISELVLIENGINKYVKKSAIQEYIDQVQPKNSVKIIELSRYPRIIPDKNLKIIKNVKELNIFDEICVVFTDFTNNEYKTEEEKELVRRNRDPICFGLFMNKDLNEKYDNFYFITDWEDEYCDLTYDKVVAKLAENSHGEIVDETLDEKWNRYYEFNLKNTKTDSNDFWTRIKKWFKA